MAGHAFIHASPPNLPEAFRASKARTHTACKLLSLIHHPLMARTRQHPPQKAASAAEARRRSRNLLAGVGAADHDVVYLGCRRRRRSLPAENNQAPQVAVGGGEPDNARTDLSTTSGQVAQHDVDAHALKPDIRGHTYGDSPRTSKIAANSIPSQVRNKSIAVGFVRGSRSRKQEVVGFFGDAGRFLLKVKRTGRNPSGAVKHTNVEYTEEFLRQSREELGLSTEQQGLSREQVREAILQRLLKKEGGILDPGEI